MSGHVVYNRLAGQSLERIAALSDGVFAIAMTLIVLEIRVPTHAEIHGEADLWHALGALSPRLLTYCLSFLTLGIFWMGQQTQLHHFSRSNRDLGYIQFLFLAAVSVLPFSTSLLSEFITLRLALVCYWLNLLVLGAALYASWQIAERGKLIRHEAPAGISSAIRGRIITAQTLYLGAMLLCVVSNALSIAAIVLIQLNYAFYPARWLKRG